MKSIFDGKSTSYTCFHLLVHRDQSYVKSMMPTININFMMDEIEQKGMQEIAKMLEKELE